MNRTAITALVAAAGALTTPALAQSFNVDIGVASGTGSGAISTGFAACGQPGVWNVITTGTRPDAKLVDITGATTAVTLTRPSTFSPFVPGANADTGEFSKLMSDGAPVNVSTNSDVYVFNGVPQGRYLVYVYFVNVPQGIGAAVDVVGFAGQSIRLAGGNAADKFAAGRNYTLSLADVDASGKITIQIARLNGGQANVAGFQIVDLNGGRKPLHVTQTGSGDRSGTSWANAMDTVIEPMRLIQEAYAYETESTTNTVDFDVWIAGGQYTVTDPTAPVREERLTVLDGTRMYGGFAGFEISPSQRNGSAETVITGEIGAPGSGDNSYKLALYAFCSDQTLTDGITFANGGDERGLGGVFQSRGAGIGLLATNAVGEMGPVFRDVTFKNNAVTVGGGAVYLYQASATFDRCTFENNSTSASNGSATGGAVLDMGPGSVYLDCDFTQNTSSLGSALYLGYSGGLVSGCRFFDNDGTYSTIHVLPGTTTEFASSLIADNHNGLNGAAIYAMGEAADIAIKNTTIAHNHAAGYSAGVLLRNGADASVFNSILWDNQSTLSDPAFPGESSIDIVNGPTDIAFAHSTVQNGTGLEAPFPAAPFFNTTLNPMFVDADGPDGIPGTGDDDYRLRIDSPAIDSGDISFAPADKLDLDGDGVVWEENPFDLNGNPRVTDLEGIGSGIYYLCIDRGAYEAAAMGDCNGNGIDDAMDLATGVLVDYNQDGVPDSCAPVLCTDLNGDGFSDNGDIGIFVSMFLSGDLAVDFNGDGFLDNGDIGAFIQAFLHGCE